MDHDNQDWIWLSIIAGNQKEAEKNKQNASLEELRHKAGEYRILAENAESENEKKKLSALAEYYQNEYQKKFAEIEAQREQEKKPENLFSNFRSDFHNRNHSSASAFLMVSNNQ